MSPNDLSETPLVPKINRPRNTMSLDWYIPVIMQYAICLGWWKITGMNHAGTLCFRDDSFWGPGVPEKSYGDTLLGHVPSRHQICGPWVPENSFGDTCLRDVPSPHHLFPMLGFRIRLYHAQLSRICMEYCPILSTTFLGSGWMVWVQHDLLAGRGVGWGGRCPGGVHWGGRRHSAFCLNQSHCKVGESSNHIARKENPPNTLQGRRIIQSHCKVRESPSHIAR